MKLKTVTLIVLFLFIAFFAVLAFVPEAKNLFKSVEEKNEYAEVENMEVESMENDENMPIEVNSETTTASTDKSENTKSVTLNTTEIAKHNTASDCYIIIRDSVYSVAGFIDKHPGGREKILSMCGKEATAIFTKIHSNFAWNLLKDFYIGDLNTTVNLQ